MFVEKQKKKSLVKWPAARKPRVYYTLINKNFFIYFINENYQIDLM